MHVLLAIYVCVREMWDRYRQRDKPTNMRAECSSSVWESLLNIWKRQRLQCCGCGDERLRSLTSCTSCWDVGSYQNPVRNRRGQFLETQILQNLSVFYSHTEAKKKKKNLLTLLPVSVLTLWFFQKKTAWFITCYTHLLRVCSLLNLLNNSEVDKNNVRGVLSPCSVCTDIFRCCCVNSCGRTVEDVAPANTFCAS